MTKLNLLIAAGAVVSLIAPGPTTAGDFRQLIGSAGMTMEEARGATLDEIVALKFSREGSDSRQVPISRRVDAGPVNGSRSQLARASGLSAEDVKAHSLDEVYARIMSRSVNGSERQTVPVPRTGASSAAARAQLAASAGISPADAAGMSLAEIAAIKFRRDSGRD